MSEKMKAQDKPNVKAFHFKKKPFSGLFLKTILNQQDRQKIFFRGGKIPEQGWRTFLQQAHQPAKPL
ncbi:MAG: hypothetical protein MUO63_07905 [Desulfobulbaceae bacterium]|nr:hypothetical protein [Desulfobulbaceae bacterium]